MKSLAPALLLVFISAPVWAAEPDGLILPDGFHAQVVSDGVKGLRHFVVTPKGDIYASTSKNGLFALKLDKNHKAGDPQMFAKDVTGGTGIKLYHGALYATSASTIYRIKLDSGLVPGATPETLVSGMPTTGFPNRMLAFDDKGDLFVSVASTGNICTGKTEKGQKPVGLTPCPGVQDRGGIWKFKAEKLGQKFPADGVQVATGLRDVLALGVHPGDGLYGVMQNRNGTHAQFPDVVSDNDNAQIAEEMFRFPSGQITNMGWPYTYWDGKQQIRLMAPEYGGNDKTQPPAGIYATPVASLYPSHSPMDLTFYTATQFPAKYRGGAFMPEHGGLGQPTPQGHAGYAVEFIPFTKAGAGAPEMFANGFAGPDSNRNAAAANFRPVGSALGPDGSLYIGDSQKGRIWRIYYGDHG
jgi:glucose/arabinose dehydrogenase